MNSLCETCSNKRKTWSKQLTEEGYIGCSILYERVKGGVDEAAENIKAETIGIGWVIFNLATNDQLITRGTTECEYYLK